MEVGLPVSNAEKFIAYIQKVGSYYSERVRLDRRSRPDGAGGTTVRIPETWEECHEVLCELENVKAGERAFNASRAAGQELQQVGIQGSPGTGTKKEAALRKKLEEANAKLKSGGLDKGKGKGKGKSKGKDGKPSGPKINPETNRPFVATKCGKRDPFPWSELQLQP